MPRNDAEDEHFLLQEEAYYRRLSRLLKNYDRLLDDVKQLNKRKEALHREMEARRAQHDRLVRDIQEQTALKASRRSGYAEEYESRQRYYRASLAGYSSFSWQELGQTSPAEDQLVIIVPDSIAYDRARIAWLFEKLAAEGVLCFQHTPGLAARQFHLHGSGFYEFSDEALMLAWLQHYSVRPVVLCNWVLQAAWFELLPDPVLWYDICENEGMLFIDADSKLKHWELLEQAALITYAEERHHHLTYYRKERACLLSSREDTGLRTVLNQLPGVQKSYEAEAKRG